MYRIKDGTKVILENDQVICQVKEKSSSIITPESTQGVKFDYLIIVAVGKEVKNYKVGDIVLDILDQGVHGFKTDGKGYIKLRKHAILIAVDPENFDPDKEEGSKIKLN